MRTFVCSLSTFLVALMLASGAGATATASGHLESVSILAAGAGSSLAVRTSAIAVLVATTATDARTVMIELVGIAADRRDLRVTDSSGMISHIGINTVGSLAGGTVTRIRVSLVTGYRHRLRTFGHLVYVDFQPVDEADAKTKLADARTTGTAKRALRATATHESAIVSAVTLESQVAANGQLSSSQTPEVNLLSRWQALTEPLQHALRPPLAATVLSREWIPLVLKDGTIIFSHGDYAAVNEQITLMLPFDHEDAPRVEAVSLPHSAIDLHATTRAAESVRAARYALTRGPREFADFSQEVSAVLNAVPSQPDAIARVNVVEAVMRRLIEWPAAHHGYRALEINEAVAMLDLILNQLRAAAGMNRVDLTLMASTHTPSPTFAFRQPTLVDLIETAMRLVEVLTVPAERTAVLRAAAESLARHRTELPAVWFANGQRRVAAALKSETQVDEEYRKLSAGIVARGARAVRERNVRAIAALQSDLLERDQRLGGKRQEVVLSTMAALQTQFEIAARAQLLRDRRELDIQSVRSYVDGVAPAVKRFRTVQRDLQQIGRVSAIPSKMQELRDAVGFVNRTLAQCLPPPQVAEAHSLMLRAAQLADVAAQEPVDRRISHDLSTRLRTSAAVEALTTFERAHVALEASLRSSGARAPHE